jgi:hypothetical protein
VEFRHPLDFPSHALFVEANAYRFTGQNKTLSNSAI